jgi:hypothetical protein
MSFLEAERTQKDPGKADLETRAKCPRPSLKDSRNRLLLVIGQRHGPSIRSRRADTDRDSHTQTALSRVPALSKPPR